MCARNHFLDSQLFNSISADYVRTCPNLFEHMTGFEVVKEGDNNEPDQLGVVRGLES